MNSPPAIDPNWPKSVQKWATTRKMGMGRFIVVAGVLSWGIPMFLLMTIIGYFDGALQLSAPALIREAVACLAGGAIFGWLFWSLQERGYQKHRTQSSR